jgi:hypothetical protein
VITPRRLAPTISSYVDQSNEASCSGGQRMELRGRFAVPKWLGGLAMFAARLWLGLSSHCHFSPARARTGDYVCWVRGRTPQPARPRNLAPRMRFVWSTHLRGPRANQQRRIHRQSNWMRHSPRGQWRTKRAAPRAAIHRHQQCFDRRIEPHGRWQLRQSHCAAPALRFHRGFATESGSSHERITSLSAIRLLALTTNQSMIRTTFRVPGSTSTTRLFHVT